MRTIQISEAAYAELANEYGSALPDHVELLQDDGYEPLSMERALSFLDDASQLYLLRACVLRGVRVWAKPGKVAYTRENGWNDAQNMPSLVNTLRVHERITGDEKKRHK